MIAYIIDKEGFIEKEIKCQESPLEPGKFLLPFYAISKPLPPLAANETVRWNGSSWVVVPDFSGKTYYSKGDGMPKIFSRGERPSDLYIDIEPPKDIAAPKWNGSAWEQDHERHSKYLKSLKRAQRIAYLNETDIYLINDYPIHPGSLEIIKRYRKYLRDIPQGKPGWERHPVLSLEEWKNAKL